MTLQLFEKPLDVCTFRQRLGERFARHRFACGEKQGLDDAQQMGAVGSRMDHHIVLALLGFAMTGHDFRRRISHSFRLLHGPSSLGQAAAACKSV